jgi:hypothetical protein
MGGGLMSLRNVIGNQHPFALPLWGALTTCLFGSLFWLFGISDTPLHGALTFAILYGSVGAIILGVAGIIWCAIKLLNIHKRNFAAHPQIPKVVPRH